MKIWIAKLFIIILIISCEKDTNVVEPYEIEPNINIEYIRHSFGQGYEILLINNYSTSIWYLGMRENFPLYAIQYYLENNWIDSDIQWCEGCGMKIEFASNDTITFNISAPPYDEWRIGIPIFISPDDNFTYKWSSSIKN
jgi:hypothetical protein